MLSPLEPRVDFTNKVLKSAQEAMSRARLQMQEKLRGGKYAILPMLRDVRNAV